MTCHSFQNPPKEAHGMNRYVKYMNNSLQTQQWQQDNFCMKEDFTEIRRNRKCITP